MPLRRAYGWVVAEPERTWVRALRGVVLIAIGLLFVVDRDAVLRVTFTAIGLYLIYAGVSVLLWLVYRPRAEHPAAAVRRRSRRPLIATLVALVLIVVAAGAFAGSGGTSTAAPPPVACNGHEELCDRPLDQVALAATHNSMSSPLPGWFSTQQDRPIPDQLHDGIRGLLIDTHYADRLANGNLRTELGDERELRAKLKQDGVSPSALDAALRTRERLGFSGKGVRGMYLCHLFCELGGVPLEKALGQLHDFLVANPGEVVVVINQDYVRPEDFVGALDKAGLTRFAYRGPTAPGRWPTLREMIDSNQRVVFLAENRAGAAPWYHPAYDGITMETPFHFSRPSQLTDPKTLAATCRPNRGPAEGAPMFLVNHWITTDPLPRPSNAEKVNAYGPLLRRLRECRRVRHHIPTLVAVDFYRRGDVFGAVDALNGVR